MNESRAAVDAAIAIVAAAGGDVTSPRVLYQGSSVIVGFGEAGPVARVGGLTAGVRDLRVAYRREVMLARHLASHGAPVVHPWEPAGPYEHGGQIASLWHRTQTAAPATAAAAGQALRHCHDALRDFGEPLPALDTLIDEAERIVDGTAIHADDRETFMRACAHARARIADHGLPEQPLHGDAGLGNVLQGGVWHDWEDSCRGPVIWDLASLVASARILGREPERAEATLRAYGDAPGLDQLDAFVAIRGLHVLAWSLLASAAEGRVRETTEARLRWLRTQRPVVCGARAGSQSRGDDAPDDDSRLTALPDTPG